MAYESLLYRKKRCNQYLVEVDSWRKLQEDTIPESQGKLKNEHKHIIDALIGSLTKSKDEIINQFESHVGFELVPIYLDAYASILKVLERSGHSFFDYACTLPHRKDLIAFLEGAHTLKDDEELRKRFKQLTFDGTSPLLHKLLEQLLPGSSTGVRRAAREKTVFHSWPMQQLAQTKEYAAAVGHLLMYYLLNCIVPANRESEFEVKYFVEAKLFGNEGDRSALINAMRGLAGGETERDKLLNFISYVQRLPRLELAHDRDEVTILPSFPGNVTGQNLVQCEASLKSHQEGLPANMKIQENAKLRLVELFSKDQMAPAPFVTDNFLRLFEVLNAFCRRALSKALMQSAVDTSKSVLEAAADAAGRFLCYSPLCVQSREFLQHHMNVLREESITLPSKVVKSIDGNVAVNLWHSNLIQGVGIASRPIARLMYHVIASRLAPASQSDEEARRKAAAEADSLLFNDFPAVAVLLSEVLDGSTAHLPRTTQPMHSASMQLRKGEDARATDPEATSNEGGTWPRPPRYRR